MKCQIILGLFVAREPLSNRYFVLQMTRFLTLKSLNDKCKNLDRFSTPTSKVAGLNSVFGQVVLHNPQLQLPQVPGARRPHLSLF